jgi:predicted nucleic acid-binding protein
MSWTVFVPATERRLKASASQRLVIDASVLHAASADGSSHPIGSRCRDTLILIREGRHAVAVTDEIIEEWNLHSSKFARAWRIAMNARRKTVPVRSSDCTDVLTVVRRSKQLSEQEVNAVEKDMHLVAAARSASRSILSLDEITRAILRKLGSETRALDDFMWANPVSEFDLLRAWLNDKEPASPLFILAAASVARAVPRHSRRKATRGRPQ